MVGWLISLRRSRPLKTYVPDTKLVHEKQKLYDSVKLTVSKLGKIKKNSHTYMTALHN